MKPRGPLMIEHRLIEKMLAIVKNKISEFEKMGKADPVFIDTAVDFIRTYADRTHHGKEEDILFRDLGRKNILEEDARVMKELIEEHQFARKTVRELVEAKENYIQGKNTLPIILERLTTLVEFYPEHIQKEDKVFFPNSERYFSEDGQQMMLKEFWEFDKTMIHEKYKSVVESFKK